MIDSCTSEAVKEDFCGESTEEKRLFFEVVSCSPEKCYDGKFQTILYIRVQRSLGFYFNKTPKGDSVGCLG